MGKKSAANQAAASERQAKIDAAAKASKVGPNKILIATVVALVAIIAVVAGVIIADQSNRSDDTSAASAVPGNAAGMGEPFIANAGVTLQEGAPTLSIFEDFRCPHCHDAFGVFGSAVSEMAADGRIELAYHFKTVIDSQTRTDESLKAASSAMCAAAVGGFEEYHDTIFGEIVASGQQPAWGADFFSDAAQRSGITGEDLTKFDSCVADGCIFQVISLRCLPGQHNNLIN